MTEASDLTITAGTPAQYAPWLSVGDGAVPRPDGTGHAFGAIRNIFVPDVETRGVI
jgi:hypothetical protein